MSMKQYPPRVQRHGVVMVAVVVCLGVAVTMATSVTHATLQLRSMVRMERQLRQTELLVQAGIDRARRNLLINPDYTGEVWRMSPDTLPAYPAARVEIAVVKDSTEGKRVHVTAIVGDTPGFVSRRSNESIPPTPSSDKESS